MEAGAEACARDAAVLSASEKREMLDALAGMIASTIEGASVGDVHAALASAEAASGEWRELVQNKVEARHKRGLPDAAAAKDRPPAVQPQPSPQFTQAMTTAWECPACGTRYDVVDARRSLRRSSTSAAVKTLSDTTPTGCPVCEGLGNEEGSPALSKNAVNE
ncbi:uncharacterized protein Tco025E_03275 [Trypanosoma conorhini]|uniref:Uncharacterized protein n=1 Tax=Trypanosoma conorhini TaxID=83891 RepID=A0A3R7PMA9_9TRYP|nr:uncharacterized protein Tco025E_03275 [Trypanosoma conorhini]RNF22113.1 hypothetical protein Tco025E_03275 [Trypanosoma conorhini]